MRRVLGEFALALLVSAALAAAVTWPAPLHLGSVMPGGGELGGWTWRRWWHFLEIEAIDASDLGPLERLRLLLSLGRYPETGNILDLLLLSWPLERFWDFRVAHNVKVLLILAGNGLAAYALARSLARSRAAALAASTVAVVNPLVFQDIEKTGLRQVLLWWLLLYALAWHRAERSGRLRDGALAGAALTATAAFYWFYGLFAGMFTLLRLAAAPRSLRARLRPLLGLALVGGLGSLVFLQPYFSEGRDASGRGGTAALPELSFFLPFPSYDTVASAPLRPQSYRENVLASLHRTIESAWPADYVFNPAHGTKALPLAVLVLGVLPALRLRRARTWLAAWLLFYAGTLGPFLKWGAQRDTSEVVHFSGYVVRLPYTMMFQFVPGMSRMFAPYRMASLVVVASVALLALSLGSVREPRRRRLLSLAAGLALVLQPFYRFDLGPVVEGEEPPMWRAPVRTAAMRVPAWYEALGGEGWEGIVELPLDRQQDVLAAWQAFHHRKVYRSWATPPAVPPAFRDAGGGEAGRRLRWLARPDPNEPGLLEFLRSLSLRPLEADPASLDDDAFRRTLAAGPYRWIVLHERGYWLVDPSRGAAFYRHAVRLLAERLGVEPEEFVEIEEFDWPGRRAGFPVRGAYLPWAGEEVPLPGDRMPTSFSMAVFDLRPWLDAPPAAGEGEAGAGPPG